MSRTAAEPSQERATRIATVIADLCTIAGPTGHEGKVRAHLERTWADAGLEPHRDPVGNLIAKVGGEGPRVLVQAHMDEIGFVVRHVTKDGFLFLDSGQGGRRDLPERRFMLGRRAVVLRREEVIAEGALVAPSGHLLQDLEAAQKQPTFAEFFLDIGAESRQEVERLGVHVGSPVVWQAATQVWGNRLVAKALDDRVGLALIELLLEAVDRDDLTCELWVGATVQEENGLHGARAMAAQERFDAVIALDVALAGDIPAVDEREVDSALGQGPVVVHQDLVVAYDQELAWDVIEAGRAAGVPVQHGMFNNYATDAGAFLEAGMPSVVLGPPARYTHTPSELVDLGDVDAAVALLAAFVTRTSGESAR